jgi:hypothetical protein
MLLHFCIDRIISLTITQFQLQRPVLKFQKFKLYLWVGLAVPTLRNNIAIVARTIICLGDTQRQLPLI